MSDPQALAMLALRRIHGRIAIPVTHLRDDADPEAFDPAALTGGDPVALGRVLGRAVERTWLTLELLFGQDAVGPRLGRGGQPTLDAIFGNRCFAQLTATPGPFRQTVWRELHAARKAGPLAQGDVDVAGLIRQMSGLTRPTDPRALQDLEWYALWQTAGELARDGYGELRSLFEARSVGGESLLIGLVTSFVPFELELEGNPPRTDLGLSLLPPEHVRWLCEQSEPVEQLLNEAYDGGRGGAPTEGAARVRQGQVFAQQGQYERAVIEFTAALQSDLSTAGTYVLRGDALRHRGEYERAVADYTQALRLEPNHLLARLNRGLVHRLTGRPEMAAADLNEALRLDPRNVVALNARGGAHADLGRYDLAIADHTQALRLDPSLAWAYQSRGDAYAGKGEYDRAAADYTQALRLNPHFPLAHANRGDAYRLAGDLDRAAADYSEALRLDPLNPRMFTSRGDTYRKQGRYELALADYTEAIRLDPTNPAGYLNRGIAYQLAGDYDRAVRSFDQAEQFDAANPEVFYQRALAYRERESYQEAIADLGRVIELNPRDAVAFVSRGSLYTLVQEFDPAVADFTEAIRLDPTSAQARLERGRVQALRGAFADALADCGEAIRLDPHFVPALLIRGGVLIRTGAFEAALGEFDHAIRANPRYARAYNDRGVALSKLDRLDDAVRDFSRAIELHPENAQALANRGNAYQLQKRHDEALRDFTQAVAIDAKYSATYCTVRGLAEAGRGNFRQALADYSVALAIDPRNRVARVAKAEAREHLETDFAVAPAATPTPPDEVVDLGAETMLALPAAPTQIAIDLTAEAPRQAAPTQVATVTEADRAEFEADQRRAREAQDQARLRELAERAAEIRKRNEAEEAARLKALSKKQKARGIKRDPEEEAERRRKIKQYVLISVGMIVLGYYAFQLIWGLIPPSKNPYPELTAEKFVAEYAKDAASADDRYVEKTVVLRGKVKIVRSAEPKRVLPGPPPAPPKVFFEVVDQEKFVVECVFEDTDIINDMRGDAEYRIAGKVQRYKPGTPITLKQAVIRERIAGPAGDEPAPAKKAATAANPWHASLTVEPPGSNPPPADRRRPTPLRILAGDPARGDLSVLFPHVRSYA